MLQGKIVVEKGAGEPPYYAELQALLPGHGPVFGVVRLFPSPFSFIPEVTMFHRYHGQSTHFPHGSLHLGVCKPQGEWSLGEPSDHQNLEWLPYQ